MIHTEVGEDVLLRESSDGVVHLIMNRPHALNALNGDLMRALVDAIDDVSRDDAVNVCVLRGVGRAFSAGVDLKWVHEERFMERPGPHLAMQDTLEKICLDMESSPVIFIGAVSGYALAGGMEILMACDLIVVSESAQLGDEHANKDIIPGGGGSQRLLRRVGNQRALHMLASGVRVNGSHAAAMGLALECVPDDQLMSRVEEIAGSIAPKNPRVVEYMKRLVIEGGELRLKESLWFERWLLLNYTSQQDSAAKGIAGFVDSRAQP